jgi:hypothetical protein
VGPESDALVTGMLKVLKDLRADGVHVTVQQVGFERDRGSAAFAVKVNLTPADEGAAPLNVQAFLNQWMESVITRGVMMVECIHIAPAGRGNGVDLEIAGNLLPAANTKSFDARVDWLSQLSALKKSIDASTAQVPGTASAGKTESSPDAETSPKSYASQRSLVTVLKELPADGEVLASVRQVRIRPEEGSIEFVLRMDMIRADGGAAPPDVESVVAFLKHWAENGAARGVKMMVKRIQTAPTGRANAVDLEVAITLR